MTIPRNLGNLAQGADSNGVLGPTKGGTGLTSVGTNGQVLQSNGTSLVYATPSAGAMSLISTISATGSSVAFTEISGYTRYFVLATQLIASSSFNQLEIEFGYGGATPTYYTSSYIWSSLRNNSTSVTAAGSSSQSNIRIAAVNNGNYWSGQLYFFGIGTTTGVNGVSLFMPSTSVQTSVGSFCLESTPNAVNAIKFNPGGNTFTSGSFSLYGIA